VEHRILSLGKKAEKAKLLLMQLYQNPTINIRKAAQLLGITHQAANTLISQLSAMEVLKEVTGFGRNRLFVFSRYLDLFMNPK
jgi:Fic family protein